MGKLSDNRFGKNYESLKPNKHNECPNCLENYNPHEDQMCLECKKEAIQHGWWNVTCNHLTGKLYRIRHDLEELVSVQPSIMSQQELEHLKTISEIFAFAHMGQEYVDKMLEKYDHRIEPEIVREHTGGAKKRRR